MTNTADVPAGCPISDIDPWADEVLTDPYPAYRTLRDLGPVVWLARHGIPALPHFNSVRAALSDHERFSSAAGAGVDEDWNVQMGTTILTSDPPLHETFRRPMAVQLSPSALAPDLPHVAEIADAMTERLVAAGSFDAVTEMASPFSVTVVADLLGLPSEGRELLAPLGERAFNVMGPCNPRHEDGRVALAQLMEYSMGTAMSGQLCPGSRGATLVAGGKPDLIGAYT